MAPRSDSEESGSDEEEEVRVHVPAFEARGALLWWPPPVSVTCLRSVTLARSGWASGGAGGQGQPSPSPGWKLCFGPAPSGSVSSATHACFCLKFS